MNIIVDQNHNFTILIEGIVGQSGQATVPNHQIADKVEQQDDHIWWSNQCQSGQPLDERSSNVLWYVPGHHHNQQYHHIKDIHKFI